MSEIEAKLVRRVMDVTGIDFHDALELIAKHGSADAVLRYLNTDVVPEIMEIEIVYWDDDEEKKMVTADVIAPCGVHAGPENRMWSIAYIPLGKRVAKAKTYTKAMKAMRWFLAKCRWEEGGVDEFTALWLEAAEMGMIER